jgi:BirA family biotin operon repressor/biotin-[acetyl-CoA-carboxylase] ligase
MKSPLFGGGEWLVVDEAPSTQAIARERLKAGAPAGVVLAFDQTEGRGRFGRTWISRRGDSLTVSMVFRAYRGHPKPYLIGMAVAIAAAGLTHVQLQWPNDLVLGKLKVGGILTEMIEDDGALTPIVGLGINLNQTEFPEEIADRATSLKIAFGQSLDAEVLARSIIAKIESLPEPNNWSELSPLWSLFDRTPGKRYQLPGGEYATAIAVGGDGQLLCSVDGESQSVSAAEAIFGRGPLLN